ncbi:MAG TPA: aromatic amino acid lyase [Steroidobacteraceae bacterium]|nr:aromatic amino acid lyase [Steroidobacteraceae bacterium]
MPELPDINTIVLASVSDMTLENAERVAFDRAVIELGAEANAAIARGRVRFEAYVAQKGGYVYGSTTAPGSRAKVVLSEQESRRQGETLRSFLALQAGPGGDMLSERCVRLAVFARLSNAMTGSGKLRPSTAQAVADLLHAVPPVPMQAVACSGEVMALTWLMAPLADLPLGVGEAMALINGSPFATAMACDVALTAGRRVKLAEQIFALSVEAAQCPEGHFDRRLADRWLDPYYRESLERLHRLLGGSKRKQMTHQSPTSWRVLPNVLAEALRALAEASRAAQIGLQSLKDNPTFLQHAADSEQDAVVSSGGYHDQRAAKAIDQVNSALTDLCVLASRHVAHLLDGGGLGLPPLLARAGDAVGAEYLAWGMTEPLATARRAAEATTLDVGLHDPAGNQSDIASLGFIAYGKHRAVARSFDACLASLAMAAAFALEFRGLAPPSALLPLWGRLTKTAHSTVHRIDAVGEPLRNFQALLRASCDDLPRADFAESLRTP